MLDSESITAVGLDSAADAVHWGTIATHVAAVYFEQRELTRALKQVTSHGYR